MGIHYTLVNQSKREHLAFAHIGAGTKHELAGNPAAAAILVWYLLEHPGDRIAFVSDTYEDWPFPEDSKADLCNYRDATDEVVAALVEAGVLADEGREVFDAEEAEVYVRRLRNIWME